MTSYTEADFDRLSWHDCHVWAVRFDVDGADESDGKSDLVLDFDYIVECRRTSAERFTFQVSPATLVFHGVTDPRININWGTSGFRSSLHPVSIEGIYRERVRDQKVFLDRPYYDWRIPLNWPEGGEIAFGAVGFTLSLLADPVLQESQHLSRRERNRLTNRRR